MNAPEKSVNRYRKQSHRGDLTERLIKILLLLAEGQRTQSELAGICGVNNVTIQRNLTELIRHYFIVDERRGREMVYKFGDNYEFRPPTLTPGELATLLLAQQTIGSGGLLRSRSRARVLNTHPALCDRLNASSDRLW